MTFAAGLIGGFADAKTRIDERKLRERELSVMEASLTDRQDASRRGRGYGVSEVVRTGRSGGGGGADAGRAANPGDGAAGFDPSSIPPEMVRGIYDTANALGVDPIEIATIISYETGGTFDPRKKGPVTQWGQHEGLIQWGEPQAAEYGVNWDDPINSQLGADGAIVRYMKSAGVEPGMGMLDLYSAVNAGRVGRYNASDANNGGAPGTVADKVRNQMDGHYAKARALFEGFQPPSREVASADGQPTRFRWFENLRGSMSGVR